VAGVSVHVFGIVGLLTLVGFLPALARRINLPYTVLLAGVGLGLGGLVIATRDVSVMGPAGDFLGALRGFDLPPEAILSIFLPTLLFETALSLDSRQLFEDLAPILLMAVVAVVVCAFCVAFALSAIFGVALTSALLLGAIVATTDPIAVVGIFRDLGAPRRLRMLVEGESLLNDASAIALYSLLLELLLGEESGGAGKAALVFLWDFLGGSAFGYLAARGALALARPLRGLPLAEITLTLALAYLVYFFAERYLEVSGVVAVVVAALTLGAVGRTRLTPNTWERLESIWQQLGFWANSLVFLLAAMLVPRIVTTVTWWDAAMLAVLILFTFLARFVVVFGLMPVLSMLGLAERIERAYGLVIVWGGLRGALSLALALAVAGNEALPEGLRHMVAVLATGFVLFTLLVNGTSLRLLIRLLGVDRLPATEQALRDRALTLALVRIKDRLGRLAKAEHLSAVPLAKLAEDFDRRIASLEAEASLAPGLAEADLVSIGLRILAAREGELALDRLEAGILPQSVADALIAGAAKLGDAAKSAAAPGYEKAAAAAAGFRPSFRMAHWLHRRFGIERPLAAVLAERFERLLMEHVILVELVEFVDRRLKPILGEATAAVLAEILKRREASIEEALAALRLQYPDYAETLEARYLGRQSLRLEEDALRNLLEESVVSQEIFNDLDRQAAGRRRDLERRPKLDVALDRLALIGKVPLFADLAAGRQRAIARLLRPRLALPGERIVAKGEKGDAMYFVASGALSVELGDSDVRLGSGDFFGEIALLSRGRRTADVTAISYCNLLALAAEDFDRLLAEDPDLKTAIDAVARERLGAFDKNVS